MKKINKIHLNNIKNILLADDVALVNIAGELNRYNNCLPTLSYHDFNKDFFGIYILDCNGKTVSYNDLFNICKEKINDIIKLMLKYYNHIDVACSDLEDYIIDNELV